MRFFRGRDKVDPEPVPVMVRPSGVPGEVVAFGHPDALAAIGSKLGSVPQPLVRGARTVLASVAEFTESARELSGEWLKLTPEAHKLLEANQAVRSGDGLLGVVRKANGKFAGQLTFVEPASATLAGGPALAAAAALQLQMVAIERRLEDIHGDLTYLIDSAHIDVEAELATNIDILDDVFDEVVATGELTATQWDRIVNIEASVRRLHHRSSGHLRTLEEALTAETVGLGEQVKRLKQAIQTNHSDLWLDVHVHAEKALTQWQTLYLLRQVDEQPERAAEFAGALKAEVTLRFRAMVELGNTIAESLTTGGEKSWTDRFRIISQARLRHLLAELDQILWSYREGVATVQLDAGSAEALDEATFDIGSWSELVSVARSPETRTLERISRTGSRLIRAGSERARNLLDRDAEAGPDHGAAGDGAHGAGDSDGAGGSLRP